MKINLPKARLEDLRAAIHTQSISYSELADLQGLADHIERNDVELLEWAGVPEFAGDEDAVCDASTVERPIDGGLVTGSPSTV